MAFALVSHVRSCGFHWLRWWFGMVSLLWVPLVFLGGQDWVFLGFHRFLGVGLFIFLDWSWDVAAIAANNHKQHHKHPLESAFDVHVCLCFGCQDCFTSLCVAFVSMWAFFQFVVADTAVDTAVGHILILCRFWPLRPDALAERRPDWGIKIDCFSMLFFGQKWRNQHGISMESTWNQHGINCLKEFWNECAADTWYSACCRRRCRTARHFSRGALYSLVNLDDFDIFWWFVSKDSAPAAGKSMSHSVITFITRQDFSYRMRLWSVWRKQRKMLTASPAASVSVSRHVSSCSLLSRFSLVF